MKVVLVVIVLVNAVFGFDKQFESDWKKFKSSHGKNYANQLDPLRAEIFRKEDAEIRAHNKRSSSFKRAHNFFSDLTEEERELYLGVEKPTDRELLENSSPMDTDLIDYRQTPPDSIDYRTHPCMPAVKNQGGCGSCWAFTALTPLEFSLCMKNSNTLTLLSEQQLVDCVYSRSGCNGGWYTTAWNTLKAPGSTNQANYKYTATYAGSCQLKSSMGISAKVASHSYVYASSSVSVDTAMQLALEKYGPLSVAIAVVKSFYSYSSGVYDDPACDTVNINHGVVVVGYGTLDDIDYWVVRNSWGPKWGAKGYILMERGTNKCKIEGSAAYVVAA